MLRYVRPALLSIMLVVALAVAGCASDAGSDGKSKSSQSQFGGPSDGGGD